MINLSLCFYHQVPKGERIKVITAAATFISLFQLQNLRWLCQYQKDSNFITINLIKAEITLHWRNLVNFKPKKKKKMFKVLRVGYCSWTFPTIS